MTEEINQVSTNNVLQEEAQKMTEKEYTKNRNEFSANIFQCILWVLLFALPLIIYIATFDIDDYNSEAHALFIGFISFVMSTPCMFFFNLICENAFKLSELKEEYRKTLPDEEIKVIEKRNKRAFKALWSIIGCVVLGIIAYVIVDSAVDAIRYDNAISYFKSGMYNAAIKEFETLDEQYRETKDYLSLSKSYKQFHIENDAVAAYYSIKDINIQSMSDEEKADVEKAKEIITEEYEAEMKRFYEELKQLEAEIEANRKAAIEKEKAEIRQRLPFVGMSEKYINQTILGAHKDSYTNNYDNIGKPSVTVYGFFDNNGYMIFQAVCEEGIVVRVYDYRSNPIKKNTNKKYTDDYDPYDIDRFSNAEDFYDDNWDYFMSYEDAEDYFNEHKK